MRHLGIEQLIKANGKTFRLSRFTRRLLRIWLEWTDTQIESPLAIAEAHFKTFPEPEILLAAAENLLQHRHSFNDPSVWELWHRPEGIRQAFALLLEKHHPEEDAGPIIKALGFKEIQKLLARANGIPPVDPSDVEKDYFISLGLLPREELPTPRTMKWAEFDASLFQHLHLTPEQIDEMTPTEITVLCKGDKGTEFLVDGALARAKLYLQLTPQQILELTRLKHPTY